MYGLLSVQKGIRGFNEKKFLFLYKKHKNREVPERHGNKRTDTGRGGRQHKSS